MLQDQCFFNPGYILTLIPVERDRITMSPNQAQAQVKYPGTKPKLT